MMYMETIFVFLESCENHTRGTQAGAEFMNELEQTITAVRYRTSHTTS